MGTNIFFLLLLKPPSISKTQNAPKYSGNCGGFHQGILFSDTPSEFQTSNFMLTLGER